VAEVVDAHVRQHAHRLARRVGLQQRRRRPGAALVAAAEHHGRAMPAQVAGGGEPDARIAAGDQCEPPGLIADVLLGPHGFGILAVPVIGRKHPGSGRASRG
jgi:hypothetical protein